MSRRLMAALAVLAGCLAGAATPGLAATQVPVNCGAGANLQAAIDAAKPGTVLAIQGTCAGTFTVGKNLVLRGVSSAMLHGEGAGTALTVTGGTVRVTKLVVTGGNAPAAGGPGGILNLSGARLTLVSVTVRRNSGAEAGGIQNLGTIALQRSLVTANSSNDVASGIWNRGTATIEQSTVSSNVGTTGIANGGFPGSATLTITDSTVSNHRSMPNGGGIANFGGSVTLVRSTIANNESGNSSGGGIENHAMLTVIESTISGNQSDEVGGGIFNQGTTTLSATILAGNTNTNDGSPDNCGGTITSNGYNLFGSPCGPLAPTDIVGTVGQPLDPMLKPLGGYGGTTNTMAPQPTSPAVNAISIGAAGGLCPSSGTTDQRGISRPQSGACDIGSVER